MKKKIKLILLIQLSVIMFLGVFINVAYATEISTKSTTGTQILSLNANAVASISPGGKVLFFFTAPETGLYTVETYGSTDTYGSVTVNNGNNVKTYTDDNSGKNKNFAIGFYQKANTVTTISVRHFNQTSGSGQFSIQVRRQKAKIYTGYYSSDGLDTTKDHVQPEYVLNAMGYETHVFQNSNAKHVEKFDSNFRNINSEIFFFSGHGDIGGAIFPIPYYVIYDNIKYEVYRLSSVDMIRNNLIMNNTKVAVWSSCFSAKTPENGKSMVQASVDLGAKSAVGFLDTINPKSAKTWTDYFFTWLISGETVKDAADFATRNLPPFDSCRKWNSAGSPSTTIIKSSKVNPKNLSSVNKINEQQKLLKQFEQDKSNFDYTLYEDHGVKRYYKTINGMITNDFYVVTEDGSIIKSNETIDQDTVSRIKSDIKESKIDFNLQPKLNQQIIEDGIVYNKFLSSEEHTIFFQKNGTITPIKIIFSDYENSDGYVIKDVECINLIDNSSIDYETLTFECN